MEIMENVNQFIKYSFEKVKDLSKAFDTFTIWNMSSPKAQAEFKVLTQNFCEEVSELWEVVRDLDTIDFYDDPEKVMKARVAAITDEVTDCLNFLNLMVIQSGQQQYVLDHLIYHGYLHMDVQELLGVIVLKANLLCNLLKNRPWKKSQFPTDMGAFKTQLIDLYCMFIFYVRNLQSDTGIMTLEQLIKGFDRKIEVNYFRIKSGY